MVLKLGMDHQGLQDYKVSINGDRELTLTYFKGQIGSKLLIVLIKGTYVR